MTYQINYSLLLPFEVPGNLALPVLLPSWDAGGRSV